LIPCVGVTPANAPEAWITDAIQVDLNSQHLSLRELSIDRAYLTSKLVRQRDETLTIYYKAWPVRHRQGGFPKTAFTLDWEAQTLCCPHQVTMPFRPGHTVRFPAETCANCPYWRLARGPGSLPHFMHVGDSPRATLRERSRAGARTLWPSLPPSYRQCAICYSNFWEAYETVLPSKRHRAVGNDSGQTNHIERFNCTLRQRVSRLVRKTLSFSKKLENHVGAIWYFIHHYNASLQL
jgi:insertion element IS1 protein InsB